MIVVAVDLVPRERDNQLQISGLDSAPETAAIPRCRAAPSPSMSADSDSFGSIPSSLDAQAIVAAGLAQAGALVVFLEQEPRPV